MNKKGMRKKKYKTRREKKKGSHSYKGNEVSKRKKKVRTVGKKKGYLTGGEGVFCKGEKNSDYRDRQGGKKEAKIKFERGGEGGKA